ncbi:hypothetical protein D3C75_754090 [compost metagenome]
MPVLIIYFFEVIDIQYRQLHGKRIALLMLNQPAQIFVKGFVVIQLGQWINLGQAVHDDILDAQILL